MKPAFIVDGFTERNIIQQICPGVPIRRTDLNGKNVTLEAMATKIASLIKLLNNRNYPIVIIVDRENRGISPSYMANELRRLISSQGISIDLRIGVADKMLENWIISDWKVLCTQSKKPDIIEGVNGCSILKQCLGSYGKTTDGVSLFLQADAKTIYDTSESFKSFVDQIKDIDCKHLNGCVP